MHLVGVTEATCNRTTYS